MAFQFEDGEESHGESGEEFGSEVKAVGAYEYEDDDLERIELITPRAVVHSIDTQEEFSLPLPRVRSSTNSPGWGLELFLINAGNLTSANTGANSVIIPPQSISPPLDTLTSSPPPEH